MLRKRANKNAASLTKLYRRTVPRNEDELCSTKEDESECANKKQRDTKNEAASDVTNYFNVSNVFECGRNNPDMSCEREYMATEYNE